MKRKTFEKKIEQIVRVAYFDDDAYLEGVIKRLIQTMDRYHESNCKYQYPLGRHS